MPLSIYCPIDGLARELRLRGHELSAAKASASILPARLDVRTRLQAQLRPYVLWCADSDPLEAESLQAIAKLGPRADAILVRSGAEGEAIARATGLSQIEVLESGIDLSQLVIAKQDEALAALGVPPGQRFVGLLSALEEGALLERFGLAQRQVPGLGLLVVGEGPALNLVDALAFNTRPSSPVIHIGPEGPATRLLLSVAANFGVLLDADLAHGFLFLAQGRRLLAPEGPELPRLHALYPPARLAVLSYRPDGLDLKAKLFALQAIDRELGPLPEADVMRARAAIDANQRLDRLILRLRAARR